jgi:GT2 family glycosyltransferase
MNERRCTSISVVMPTHGREDAIKANFHSVLALRGIDEIVVVCDGPSPESRAAVERFGDSRVRIIELSAQVGAPAARMEGINVAKGSWILVVEDDCRFPIDYAEVLLTEAQCLDADIMGAPWVHAPEPEIEDRVVQLKQRRAERLTLESPANSFPRGAVETPFMPNLALISSRVFERVRFDPGYRGNAWREETSFYISATRAGYRCVLTDATHSVQVAEWQGGQRRSRLVYEFWVWRNEVRFLRMHGRWLSRHGLSNRRRFASVQLTISRLAAIIRAGMKARLDRVQAARRGS